MFANDSQIDCHPMFAEELTPGPSLQAERGAQILAFIPDYLVVFENAASDIPPLCFQRGGQGVSKI